MFVKILHWVGIAACITLIVSCFMPWGYYADIDKTFTGFFSYKYGKPGKYLVFLGAIVLLFMLLPKVWAKRVNLFLTGLGVGYAIRTYVLYTTCYNAYCPEKKIGIILMLIASVIMMVASIFPKLDMSKSDKMV